MRQRGCMEVSERLQMSCYKRKARSTAGLFGMEALPLNADRQAAGAQEVQRPANQV